MLTLAIEDVVLGAVVSAGVEIEDARIESIIGDNILNDIELV